MTDKITITDSLGRTLIVEVLTPSGTLALLDAAGESSTNSGYVQFAACVASVRSIDGIPVPTLKNKIQIAQYADKLGNEGLSAVFKATFGTGEDGIKPIVDAAKN